MEMHAILSSQRLLIHGSRMFSRLVEQMLILRAHGICTIVLRTYCVRGRAGRVDPARRPLIRYTTATFIRHYIWERDYDASTQGSIMNDYVLFIQSF